MGDKIENGDRVVLWHPGARRFLITVEGGVQRVGGLGVVKGDAFLGKAWGDAVAIGDEEYRLLPPRLPDTLALLERRAQVILPKDGARILLECGVGPGDRVAEAGVGSGGLTIALAHAVGDDGVVLGFDVRADHLDVTRRNLEQAGLAGRVNLVEGDITDQLKDGAVDAIVLDVPDPGRVVAPVAQRLRVGGSIACYTPLVSQMEAARDAMAAVHLADVRSLETLEREWINRGTGSRPETKMLGHTGFLTFARRVTNAP